MAVALLFTAGSVAGALCAALSSYAIWHYALLGGLPRVAIFTAVLLLAALSLLWHVTGRQRFPLDRSGVQASKSTARHGWQGTLYFGLLLGFGFLTQMATPLWYMLLLASGVGGVADAVALGIGAGLGRSWPVARAAAVRVRDERMVERGLDIAAPHDRSDRLRAATVFALLAATIFVPVL